MSSRGIIMQGESVRAILAGRKTQTRRLVTPAVPDGRALRIIPWDDARSVLTSACFVPIRPGPEDADAGLGVRRFRSVPGSILYVKEACKVYTGNGIRIVYAADETRVPGIDTRGLWGSPLFMPRARARLWLRVTRVRIERLQDLTEEDARAEGIDASKPLPARINGKAGTVQFMGPDATRKAYAALWDGFHGKKSPWSTNPWIWAVTFERTERPALVA